MRIDSNQTKKVVVFHREQGFNEDMIGTRRNELEMELDDNDKFEGNEDLGSFTEL